MGEWALGLSTEVMCKLVVSGTHSLRQHVDQDQILDYCQSLIELWVRTHGKLRVTEFGYVSVHKTKCFLNEMAVQ